MVANKSRVTDLFCTMTQIYSPSSGEEDFAIFMVKQLKNLGIEAHLDKYGNVIGKIEAYKVDKAIVPPIMFSGHLDVVEPCKDIHARIIQDERGEVVVSDGTTVLGADDKAALAMLHEALYILKTEDLPHGPIEFAFTKEEETGMDGAKNLDLSIFNSKVCFVPDHTGEIGHIITKAPHYLSFNYTFKGVSAHAGMYPELGTNAISIAAKAISQFHLGKIDHETTANIGLIHGGSGVNVVPDFTVIRGEIRSHELNKIYALAKDFENKAHAIVQEYPHASLQIDQEIEFYSIDIDPTTQSVQYCSQAAKNEGLDFQTHTTCGGSDGNIFNQRGLETVVLCCGYHNPHRKDEWVSTKDLKTGSDYILSIIKAVQGYP